MNKTWTLVDSECRDFIVTEGERKFGLEVCEIFTGRQNRKTAGKDIRLLIVANRINNSGKLVLEKDATLDLRGFQVVYFFSYPESVKVFGCAGNQAKLDNASAGVRKPQRSFI